MRRVCDILIVLLIAILMLILTGAQFAQADETGEPEIVIITIAATPTPTPTPMLPAALEPTTNAVITTPAPGAESWRDGFYDGLPFLPYDEASGRCTSRAIWSVVPKGATKITKIAFAEIPQNMVDDGRYKDTIRYTLLMETEFPGYEPDAYRSPENNEIADLVMRSWECRKQGNDEYRLLPANALRYSFYRSNGNVYIEVYDFDWNVVFDSGKIEEGG